MNRCVACSSDQPTSTCSACGFTPPEIDGFRAYAPELAYAGGGYDVDLFAELAPLEASNFWFTSRNELIEWSLRRYRPDLSSFLEIGCGTGFVLSGVAAQHPNIRILGSEIFVDGLPFAAERVPGADLMQMDARHLPFVEEVDVVGAFDVLEHIEEDEEVLGEIHRTLTSDGVLLITVPQHAWLWSPADDHAFHVRRYTARELRDKLGKAGFEVLRSTSFVSLLLPFMMLSRLLEKVSRSPYDPQDELKLPRWLNKIFRGVMRVEFALIRRGMTFPWGGSRLVVARKIGDSSSRTGVLPGSR